VKARLILAMHNPIMMLGLALMGVLALSSACKDGDGVPGWN